MSKLIWFRRDLRLYDNPALHQACQDQDEDVIAIYFITPLMWKTHDEAACKIEFILQGLHYLQQELAELNIPLLTLTLEKSQHFAPTLLDICNQNDVSSLFFNKEYEVDEQNRDNAVEKLLTVYDIKTYSFDDQCILPPGSVKKSDNNFYSKFTSFKKTWLKKFMASNIRAFPKPLKQKISSLKSPPIPKEIDGFTTSIDISLWNAGEKAANKRLNDFIQTHLLNYKDQRDFPALSATSSLSPYLATGMLSAKHCFLTALAENQGEVDSGNPNILTWMNELIWREFYRHILVAFPKVCRHQPFQDKTNAIRWHKSETLLAAWQQGKTGFPIVDAAMRQLNATGWMHNRCRMICAMFLSKNLFLDWRLGERYFMQQLIDGDLASNNGGWQWSASVGTDAAPYFRIFNPISQSQRFDPQGEYIRQYCPELAVLDNKAIHDPHTYAPELMKTIDYPLPIVDVKQSRLDAITAFKAL